MSAPDSQRLKVAAVSWTSLELANTGGKVRFLSLLQDLPHCDVLLLAPGHHTDHFEQIGFVNLPTSMLRHVPANFNSEIFNLCSLRAKRKCRNAIEEFKPDVIFAWAVWAVPAYTVAKRIGVPLVVDVQNLEAQAAAKANRSRWVKGAIRSLECRRYSQASVLCVVSEADKNVLKSDYRVPEEKIRVIPNGVTVWEPKDKRNARQTLNLPQDVTIALFTGKLTYPPNRAALRWIHESIQPMVHCSRPDVQFVVVGGNRGEPARTEKGIVYTGYVPQVSDYIDAADVCIAPLPFSTGTPLKLLEYMAGGKPIIATEYAAGRLGMKDGTHYMRANDPKTFSEKLLELVESPEMASRLGDAARQLALEKYRWSRISSELEQTFLEVTEAGRLAGAQV